MKIISYSDIHLEFPKDLKAPADSDAGLMILSGDVVNMREPEPLARFMAPWKKPAIFVPGNHEYYTGRPMTEEIAHFRVWLKERLPNVALLVDEELETGGVNFFGGTMWTDFGGGNEAAMKEAQPRMTDFTLIRTDKNEVLAPRDTIGFHAAFRKKLLAWLEKPLQGPRVVITHHAPVLARDSIYDGSPLIPAFNSLDMDEIIEKHKPDFWFYGHTHECDRQVVGGTRMVSNQLGYLRGGAYECGKTFDPQGAPVIVGA